MRLHAEKAKVTFIRLGIVRRQGRKRHVRIRHGDATQSPLSILRLHSGVRGAVT